MEKNSLKKIAKLLPIIGVAIFVYIIYNIGFEKIADAFLSIPIQYFFLALLIVFLRIFVYTYKWSFICNKMKINIGYFDLVKIYLIGIFYGNLTPGALGLHLRIFYMRKKSQASIGKCLANSIIDIETALITGIFIGLVGTIFLIDFYPGLLPIIILLFILHSSLLVIFMKKSGGSRFFKIFLRPLIPKKYREGIDQSIDLLYEDMPKIREISIPILFDFITWAILGTQVYIIAQAFSVDIPYLTFLMLHTLSVIVYGILPISVGGLGIREGTFVFLLLPFGVKAEVAFVISLCGYIVKMLIPALSGMFFSFKER
jgi:uncharacterized protein (TIRG00374 family)